jgi:2-dehydro-3-deoxygluconokinase
LALISANEIGLFDNVRAFSYGIGGAESNVAIAVSRLGQPASWLGAVGQDATGDLIQRRLTAEGVVVHAIRVEAPTGLMVKHHRLAGHANIDYHRAGSAGSRLQPEDLPEEHIQQSGILHLTGITPALSATARDTVFAAAELARQNNVTVSLDINYWSRLWKPDETTPVLKKLTALAYIIFAEPEEAQILLDPEVRATDKLARGIAALSPTEVIIKDGARGATAVIGDRLLTQPAVPVTTLDTVGAGDAFVAAYLAEHLKGADPQQRLYLAACAGAFAVSVPGDCENLLYTYELALVSESHEDARR